MGAGWAWRPRGFWLGLVAAAVGVVLVGAWVGTLRRNAWRAGAPGYVAVHGGSVYLLSPLWRPGRGGVRAWESDGWMYDVYVIPPVRWRVDYRVMGTAYGGTPQYIAKVYAVTVPIWWLAVPPLVIAWRLLRRGENWRRPGFCRACGYDVRGGGGVCPECGAAVGGGD